MKANMKKKTTKTGKKIQSMAAYEKELAKYAEQGAGLEKTGDLTQYISTKGKKFTLGDVFMGTEIDVVVLRSAYENAYYEGAYNPDKPTPPVCFAMGNYTDEGMEPHETAPKVQAPACGVCAWNEWESGTGTGKGKACKNSRRLALYAYGEDGLYIDQVAYIRISPTGLNNWSGYVKSIATRLIRPPFGVVTKLTFDDNSDYPIIIPVFVEKINKTAELDLIMEGRELCADFIMEPYNVSTYVEPKKRDKKKAKVITKKKRTRSRMS